MLEIKENQQMVADTRSDDNNYQCLGCQVRAMIEKYVLAMCCPKAALINVASWIMEIVEDEEMPVACEDCHNPMDCTVKDCRLCFPPADAELGGVRS